LRPIEGHQHQLVSDAAAVDPGCMAGAFARFVK
jgi:hypothetical protein